MKLEELFLKKEELPIIGNLHKIFFQVPIHPKLLDNSLNIDRGIAQRLFPQVVEKWYEELKNYIPSDREEMVWINNLFSERDLIDNRRSKVLFMNNGLVKTFSIDNNKGGALHFDKQVLNYKSYALTYIRFTEEKYKEFASEKDGDNIFVYSQENINTHSKALFLRNWPMAYMNEVLKQVC
ncbi:MAG: hypothetical protein AABY32_04790 [Nanoarchaeota archaeon]